MLTRNWRWGTSLAFQLILSGSNGTRAFHTSSSHPYLRAATTALSVSTLTATDTATTYSSDNPLLRSWSDQPFNLPPFKSIEPKHFVPALEAAMEAHISDLEAIASAESKDDFDTILGTYDRAGSLYSKVASVYGNYISSLNTPDMQEVQTKMAPILSRHRSACYNVPGLFDKIEHMYNIRDKMLAKGEWDDIQARLAERVYIAFMRMGAKLDEDAKKEYADIQGEYICA